MENTTMASKNVETLRAAYDSWNKRDFDGVVQNMADNVSYTDQANNRIITSRQGFRDYVESWAKAMTDGRISNYEFIDAGDTVVAQFTGTGTNDGPFMGLQPTGKRLTFSFCEICRFDKHGRVISGGAYYDVYSILTQLGHVRPLAQAA